MLRVCEFLRRCDVLGVCCAAHLVSAGARVQILKKHDKLCGSKAGQDFLQSLWSGVRRSQGAARACWSQQYVQHCSAAGTNSRWRAHPPFGRSKSSSAPFVLSASFTGACSAHKLLPTPNMHSAINAGILESPQCTFQ